MPAGLSHPACHIVFAHSFVILPLVLLFCPIGSKLCFSYNQGLRSCS
jgi:hypothetical protein